MLSDDAPSGLGVYKGTMNARAVADRLEVLAKRSMASRWLMGSSRAPITLAPVGFLQHSL